MRFRPSWTLLTAALLACGGALQASGQGKGAEKKSAVAENRTVGEKVREALPPSEPVFTEQERALIRGWFRHHRAGLPPGLAKRDELPPGLAKQLGERGKLPPGLDKKLHPLPWDLERQLRRLPTGYRRVVIGGNIILMNERTAVIYDILREVIP